jgi:hypothetical protein
VSRFPRRLAAIGLLFAVWAEGAAAQRLLVETTAYSAQREATRVYLHSVDFPRLEAIPALSPLPAPAPSGRLLLTPDGRTVLAVTGLPWTGRDSFPDMVLSYLSAYESAPLRALPGVPTGFASGWGCEPGCLVTDAAGRTGVVMLAQGLEAGSRHGRLELRLLAPDGAPGGESLTWPLPGVPVAAVALTPEGEVAVLCQETGAPRAVLHARNVFTGEVRIDALPVLAGSSPVDAVSLALGPDGHALYAVTSGYAYDHPSGGATTWLTRYDTFGFEPLGAPLEIPGAADPDQPPAVEPDGACWLATFEPAMGFAYASRAAPTVEGLVLEVQVPFMDVSTGIQVAPAPDGSAVAVAVDERLEVWPGGRVANIAALYRAPVAVLRWTAEGLVLGEGNRIHAIDPATAEPVATIPLPTGRVSDAVLVPAAALPGPDEDADGLPDADELRIGTDPARADTDGDAIPDGVDPEPTRPSPQLSVPAVIAFHGESVGQEIRAVLVNPPHGDGARWQVRRDAQAAPWLSVYPLEGRVGEPFYLGVEASRYPASAGFLQTTLEVSLSGPEPVGAAAGSPASILVQVVPQPSEVPSVLWLLGDAHGPLDAPGDPYGLGPLAALLTDNPHRFAHEQATGAHGGPLAPHRVVVVDAKAAAHGAVTRQALLDYVAEGGALLFLGGPVEPAEAAAITDWLAPLGIYLDSSTRIDGAFPAKRPHWLIRHWQAFEIRDGLGARVLNPDSALVSGPAGSGLSVLVAQPYGRGRIALLGAPTPLQSPALEDREHQRFASDLFRWLARNGTELEDADGDGLPDSVEDANGNGVWDPGETDRFNPDTDGDGIPDGREDPNFNGRVDEGETNPLNPDTNGNGIPDGAEADPLPPFGAPHVEAVTPASGPAEGGGRVFVSGRNFAPDCRLWFGGEPALDVRRLGPGILSAIAPPAAAPEGGEVEVRVMNGTTPPAGVLPVGYRYTPRSRVRVIIEPLGEAAGATGGSVAVRVEADGGIDVGRISLRLESDPATALRWTGAVPGSGARFSGRRIADRPSPSGGLWIDASPARTGAAPGEIAIAHWQSAAPLGEAGPVAVRVEACRISAANGQSLDVDVVTPTLGSR